MTQTAERDSPSRETFVKRHKASVVPVLLGALLMLAYAATITHGVVSTDVWSAEFGSWHLASAGNPWIEGMRIPLLDNNPLRSTWVMDTPDHTVIARSPGAIAAAIPLYALADRSSFSLVPGGLTAALLVTTAVALMYAALRSQLRQRDALLCASVFALGTPLWSVAANGMWPHTVTVLGICGMAWASSGKRWWWAGVFGGITLWGRLHAALIVAAFGLLVGLRQRRPAVALRIAVASGAFLVLLCAWTRWMYDSWSPTASYNTGPFADYAAAHRIDVVNQLGFWIAPDRGILVWTPIILLLVPALLRSWRQLPDWSTSLLWGGLAYTFLQGVLNRFSGGDVFYGYRLMLEMLACATPALAFSAPQMGRFAKVLAGPTVALQFVAIAWGACRDTAWLPNSQVWHHNAFEVAVGHGGAAGWLTVALAVGLGFLVQRMLFGTDASADERT